MFIGISLIIIGAVLCLYAGIRLPKIKGKNTEEAIEIWAGIVLLLFGLLLCHIGSIAFGQQIRG